MDALRLVREHEPPLLVAHIAVRCGSEALAQTSRSEALKAGGTRADLLLTLMLLDAELRELPRDCVW